MQTDVEKAKELVEALDYGHDTLLLDEVFVDELYDILAKNQNDSTGDGSFSKDEWHALRDFLNHYRDMKIARLSFLGG